MAYVIGSQKGKDIAKNMKTGETYKASDGSTWTKKSDGSVSVTHNGVTTNNAYTASSSGGSSGGGGSSSNKSSGSSYSQYTAPTLGDTWNANTDYQAIINNAVNNGDYVTAAKAEQLRNQKITATGSNYNTTNMYAGYLKPDYGTIGQQQMANGASWEDVLDTWNARQNKANTTAGLEQFAGDEIQDMMWNYIVDKMKESNQPEEWEEPERPDEYEKPYNPQIDALLNEILNREDFSYDAMSDPLYQQYAAMYQREGDRAMKETMAEAAAGAGGMNTYAITAAQQANSYYGSKLNDMIPQLYQLAYEMYLNDKESKVQDLGILQNMDATQYNRYRDTINDYYNDRNFAYGVYQDAVQQGNWNTNFDYNSILDNRNWNNEQYWANKEWNTNQEDKEYDRNLYDQESAKEEVWKLIELGVTPSAELIAKAGMSETDVSLAVAAVKAQQAKTGTSSGGGNGGGGGNGYTGNGNDDDDKKKVEEEDDLKGYEPTDAGLPPYKNENYSKVVVACEKLANSGDKWGAAALAKESLDKGYITQDEYNELLRKYNPALESMLGISPGNVFGIK